MADRKPKVDLQQALAEPWERQPKESDEAWEAFVLYRDMGVHRGLRKVAKKLKKSMTLISRWSSEWLWTVRVAAWDNLKDREQREAQLEEVRKMGQRHARRAMRLQDLAMDTIEAKLVAAEQGMKDNPNALKTRKGRAALDMTISEVTRLLEMATRLERLARGEPETIGSVAATVEGGTTPVKHEHDLSDRTESAVERVLGRIAGIAARIGTKPSSDDPDGGGSTSP